MCGIHHNWSNCNTEKFVIILPTKNKTKQNKYSNANGVDTLENMKAVPKL